MHEPQTMRERQINIRLSDEEAQRLDALAAHYGLNIAGVLRMLVKRDHDALARGGALTAQTITGPQPQTKSKKQK